MTNGSDAVQAQQRDQPAHVGVTSFHLIHHENFALAGGTFGPDDKYRSGIDPRQGAISLSPEELRPIGPKELRDAKAGGTVGAYVDAHRVVERFVYVFSVEPGQPPVFRYELFVDEQGRIKHLRRDDFISLHGSPSVGEEPDATYVARPEWKGGQQQFFEQTLSIVTHNADVRWHFFSVPFHLPAPAVGELEADAAFFAPDPGFDPSAPKEEDVEGFEVWKGGKLVPVRNGMVVRVLDPLRVLDNMRAELAVHLDAFITYALPAGEGDRLERTKRRSLISAIAGSARSLIAATKDDIKFGNIEPASKTWPELRDRCFTPEELEVLATLRPEPIGDGHEFFLQMDAMMREVYLERQTKAAVKCLLWLMSKPWAFLEKHYTEGTSRLNASGQLLLAAVAGTLERVCETDVGRNHLNALIEICEEAPDNPQAIPNVTTLQTFLIRDKPGPTTLDTAKIVYKAGKTPFDLWSKLVTLYGAKNKEFLRALVGKDVVDPKVLAKIEKLGEQKQVFMLSGLTMTKRLNRMYGFTMLQADITEVFAPEGKSAIVLFANDPLGDGIDRTFSLTFKEVDDLDDKLAQLQLDAGLIEPEPRGFRRLEFNHVTSATGFVNLFFSARDVYIAATEKGAFDVAKSSFSFLVSIYSLPWVADRVKSRFERLSAASLAGAAGGWMGKSGVARVAFGIQAITVAFAAVDLWSKADRQTTEDTIGSGLSLSAEIVMLISAGLVVLSGGVLTPAAAILALIGTTLAAASFVYTLLIPTDRERALSDCIFGTTFPRDESGRPWQACPNNQLRFLDPAKTTPEFRAYENQISAFSNLMHNFNLAVELSDETDDLAPRITIAPGSVPRAAYFDIESSMRWWTDGEPDDATWSGTLRFRYYPFPDNVPPLQSPQSENLDYANLRRRGVVDPQGGAFGIFISSLGANPIVFSAAPRVGDPTYWDGVIDNVMDGGTRVPGRVGLKYDEQYQVRSGLAANKEAVIVELQFLPGTSTGLSVTDVSVSVDFIRVLEQQDVGAPKTRVIEPTFAVDAGPDGRERVQFEIPVEEPTSEHRITSFRVTLTYADGVLGEPAIISGPTDPLLPDAEPVVDRSIVKPRSDKLYDFEMPYRGRVVHTGKVGVVEIVCDEGKVIDPQDATKFRPDALVLESIVLQYIRNPRGGANAEGSATKPIQHPMFPVAGGLRRFKAKTSEPTGGGPIQVLDDLAIRFAATMHGADGQELRTRGPFQLDLVAGLGWESSEDEETAGRGGRIAFATCRVTLVLDGDPASGKFMPNRVDGTKVTPASLETTARFLDVQRGVAIGTSSPEVTAIAVCKTT